LYAYRCTQCGHRFEKIQSFSAELEKVCPQCGGPLERPLTAPRLQFKGAGWYVNDYAPKSTGSSADSAPSETKPETKTESKPDTKTSGGGESSPASPAAPPASAPTTGSSTS